MPEGGKALGRRTVEGEDTVVKRTLSGVVKVSEGRSPLSVLVPKGSGRPRWGLGRTGPIPHREHKRPRDHRSCPPSVSVNHP